MTDDKRPPTPRRFIVLDEATYGEVTGDEAIERLGAAGAEIVRGLKAGFAQMGRRFGQTAAAARAARTEQPPRPAVDMSPRAVALRARQNRHTGPRGNRRRHRGR